MTYAWGGTLPDVEVEYFLSVLPLLLGSMMVYAPSNPTNPPVDDAGQPRSYFHLDTSVNIKSMRPAICLDMLIPRWRDVPARHSFRLPGDHFL